MTQADVMQQTRTCVDHATEYTERFLDRRKSSYNLCGMDRKNKIPNLEDQAHSVAHKGKWSTHDSAKDLTRSGPKN